MLCQVQVSAKINVKMAKGVRTLHTPSDTPPWPFYFSPNDLRSLLRAFQSGFLKEHDKIPQTWRDKAISYEPTINGPSMLPMFTWGQVAEVSEILQAQTITRQGTQQPGWYWYVIQVWTGFADPTHKDNETRPEVREKDKVRAILATVQRLAVYL